MQDSTITVQRGDNASIGFVLSNSDGSPYNAAGQTLIMTVRKSAGSSPVLTKNVTSFTSGGSQATIALSETDLDLDVRAWRYELVLDDGAGHRKSSGYNTFYVTENDGQADTVNVTIGSQAIDVAVTLTQQTSDTADKYYRQDFTTATSVTVPHNLNKRPSVTVVDSAGDEVEVAVQHLDDNTLTLGLAGGFSGSVYCN